jgi:predicted nuclease of predicted toxin-antitoxin system
VIRFLVDVSVSPACVDVFNGHGWFAVHRSTVGDPNAADRTVMAWARNNRYVVFTHDLDFGTVLALTRAVGPSVIRVRAHDVLLAYLERFVVSTLHAHEAPVPDEFPSRDSPVTPTMSSQTAAT